MASSSSLCISSSSAAASASTSSPLRLSHVGLRRSLTPPTSNLRFASKTSLAKSPGRVRCDAASAPLVISLSTGALLFLGRFVFLPFQRSQVAKAGLPVQNGITHYEAGDGRAAEASGLLKTNDPAGFTLIDVLAWGALGHAVAFFILATASNGYDPQF